MRSDRVDLIAPCASPLPQRSREVRQRRGLHERFQSRRHGGVLYQTSEFLTLNLDFHDFTDVILLTN